jgi:hypothetical protein
MATLPKRKLKEDHLPVQCQDLGNKKVSGQK